MAAPITPHTPDRSTRGDAQKVVKDTPRENVQWHRDLSLHDLSRLATKAGLKAWTCMISSDKTRKGITVAHVISREKRLDEFEVSSPSTLEDQDLIRVWP